MAFDSVLWNAVEQSNTPDDLYDLMDMLPSELVTASSLSIAWSWLLILADLWKRGNTSTIETASSLITDLKTLSSLLSTITAGDIIEAETQPSGGASSVWYADALFRSVYAKSSFTLTTSATGSATGKDDGSELRPDVEFIILARKPLIGTVAANVLAHGTGALNIDASRIATDEVGGKREATRRIDRENWRITGGSTGNGATSDKGRWPPNVLLDDTAAAMLDQMSGEWPAGAWPKGKIRRKGVGNVPFGSDSFNPERVNTDTGGASRFFPVLPIDDPDTLRMLYCAKSSRRERNAGLDGLPERTKRILNGGIPSAVNSDPRGMSGGGDRQAQNHHPTVKPLALMRWLLTLVTPPGGTVLDPFAGSGTTGVAAAQLGIPCVLIEQEAEYLPIICGRIDHALNERTGAELPLFAGLEAQP